MTSTELFFRVATFGFILLFVFAAVFLYYLIKAVRAFHTFMDKVEDNIDRIGEAGGDLIDDMRNSVGFKLLFGRKKSR